MADFWIFEAIPMSRARLHRSDCTHCNNGQGQLGQLKNGSGSTRWTPFSTMTGAILGLRTMRHKDKKACGHCLPSQPV